MSSKSKRYAGDGRGDYAVVDKDLETGVDEEGDGFAFSWVGMYIIGLIVCGATEGILLGFLYFFHTNVVSVVTLLVLFSVWIFVACAFWNSPYHIQLLAVAIVVAFSAGVFGGLWGGHSLHLFWKYGANEADNVSAAADPNLFENSHLFNFVPERTYVKRSLTGVHNFGTEKFCAAPILTKDIAPQDAVMYWAVDKNCCGGNSAGTVRAYCSHWDRTTLTGEVVDEDTQHWHAAMAAADEWNDFRSLPNPVFVHVMSYSAHLALQDQREDFALLVILLNLPLWPVLALLLALMRQLAYVTCGLKSSDWA